MIRRVAYVYIPIFVSILCLAYPLSAQTVGTLSPFDKNDSVLILAPHPDDETIATGGVIQRALKAGAKVKVVFCTNGDSNEPAFIVYEKRLTFLRGEFIHMGEVRRKEALSALSYLGVGENDVIFLGYPDAGTMEMVTKYWGNTKPFKSFFTRASKVPYPECMSAGAPYTGDSILRDIEKIISKFRPNKIFVSHPADTNADHRSLYLILRIALWDLRNKIENPQVFPYVVHVRGWLKTRGFHPELRLDPPPEIKGIVWKKLMLDSSEIANKRSAISFHKSEIEYNPPYLFTYARRNELFGDFPEVILKARPESKPEWQEVSVPECTTEQASGVKTKKTIICALAYAFQNGDLLVRFNLRREIDKDIGISVSLLGYSREKNFSIMPKIKIHIDLWGMKIYDKKEHIFVKGASLIPENNAIILKLPLANLGDPDYILSSARTVDLPADQTAWRVIYLDKGKDIPPAAK